MTILPLDCLGSILPSDPYDHQLEKYISTEKIPLDQGCCLFRARIAVPWIQPEMSFMRLVIKIIRRQVQHPEEAPKQLLSPLQFEGETPKGLAVS
jgi:hypothetical protein